MSSIIKCTLNLIKSFVFTLKVIMVTIDFGAVTNMPVEKHLNHHLVDYY
jgi:hypothetical protein